MSIHQRITSYSARAVHELAISAFVAAVLAATILEETRHAVAWARFHAGR